MFKCPYGFLGLLFIYSCVCVYFRCFYISLLMMALDEILVKTPVCLGTRQFFELLEDSVGMTNVHSLLTSLVLRVSYWIFGLVYYFPSLVSLVTVQFFVSSAGARRFTISSVGCTVLWLSTS